ncbi:MAG: glycosyltransferase, partial [Conexivisphaerales archaeon]|nr:glycosyltransferase [Conexivisphaerales archaeon]
MISVIVPCRVVDDYARECVERCLSYFDDAEILVVPDVYNGELDQYAGEGRLRIVVSGKASPGRKRNLAMSMARGEAFAFIDSDAYPERDWLRRAAEDLRAAEVVGGPAVTPEEDSSMQRASGYVYSSPLMGGLSERFTRKSPGLKEVDLLHSVNCVARRGVIESVGGWDERYWPGEDTLLCGLLRRKGIKLYHDSELVVYHHRRELYVPHLRQVAGYGFYRGFLVRRYGREFFRPIYFLPMAFVIYLILGAALSLLSGLVLRIFLATLAAFAAAVLAVS